MKTPKNFNAVKFMEEMSSASPLVDLYFMREQSDIMDAIDDLYNQLNLNSGDIPLTVIELLGV